MERRWRKQFLIDILNVCTEPSEGGGGGTSGGHGGSTGWLLTLYTPIA